MLYAKCPYYYFSINNYCTPLSLFAYKTLTYVCILLFLLFIKLSYLRIGVLLLKQTSIKILSYSNRIRLQLCLSIVIFFLVIRFSDKDLFQPGDDDCEL